jgi:hypothetical protein
MVSRCKVRPLQGIICCVTTTVITAPLCVRGLITAHFLPVCLALLSSCHSTGKLSSLNIAVSISKGETELIELL